jgi:hypothetical protein
MQMGKMGSMCAKLSTLDNNHHQAALYAYLLAGDVHVLVVGV